MTSMLPRLARRRRRRRHDDASIRYIVKGTRRLKSVGTRPRAPGLSPVSTGGAGDKTVSLRPNYSRAPQSLSPLTRCDIN